MDIKQNFSSLASAITRSAAPLVLIVFTLPALNGCAGLEKTVDNLGAMIGMSDPYQGGQYYSPNKDSYYRGAIQDQNAGQFHAYGTPGYAPYGPGATVIDYEKCKERGGVTAAIFGYKCETIGREIRRPVQGYGGQEAYVIDQWVCKGRNCKPNTDRTVIQGPSQAYPYQQPYHPPRPYYGQPYYDYRR